MGERMKIDHQYSDRYLIVYDDGRIGRGWAQGIDWTQHDGSPRVHLDHDSGVPMAQRNRAEPYDLSGQWPDTADYDQNSPGILAQAADLDRRAYASDIEKAFWLNTLRVPLCASYLAACALVQPDRILELGTGGDSAHSTGMFLAWLRNRPHGQLVSVDRHYLSHTWLRYREHVEWTFIQGDSVQVMKQLYAEHLPLPSRYDLIFIDSSHLYKETLAEIHQASLMTDSILFDDSTVPDVKKAIDDFLFDHKAWLARDLHPGVTFIERHEYLSTT